MQNKPGFTQKITEQNLTKASCNAQKSNQQGKIITIILCAINWVIPIMQYLLNSVKYFE